MELKLLLAILTQTQYETFNRTAYGIEIFDAVSVFAAALIF